MYIYVSDISDQRSFIDLLILRCYIDLLTFKISINFSSTFCRVKFADATPRMSKVIVNPPEIGHINV